MKKFFAKTPAFLFVMLFSVLAAYQGHQASLRLAHLTHIYRGALLSAMQQMESMQILMQKALVSAADEEKNYLHQIAEEAGQVQRSLALLPLSHPDTMRAMKLTNQLEDYSTQLMEKEGLSESDAGQLAALTETCKSYAQLLYDRQDALLSAMPETVFYPAEAAGTVDGDIHYPTLIYDGPFSDARRQKPIPFAGEKEITWEEAARIARQFLGAADGDVRPGADILGPVPCHGVTLIRPGITLDAAVSKAGGKVMWISCSRGDFASLLSPETCEENARRFLQAQGFENMEVTAFQVYQGVIVFSFAPRQGQVLLYPDLVKIQLRMDTGEVIGLEATAYWQNHSPRGLMQPALSAQEAAAHINSRLERQAHQLCLIPLDDQEILCWEFDCAYQDMEFLVYINAQNGRQEELLQKVETNIGPETV